MQQKSSATKLKHKTISSPKMLTSLAGPGRGVQKPTGPDNDEPSRSAIFLKLGCEHRHVSKDQCYPSTVLDTCHLSKQRLQARCIEFSIIACRQDRPPRSSYQMVRVALQCDLVVFTPEYLWCVRMNNIYKALTISDCPWT